ncbi:putative RNA-directed DNA polymerase [Tanacetum coccineum]
MESNDEDDDDSSINNEENKSDGDEDDDGDDDEFYDDGLEYNPVRLDCDNDNENYVHGGGWIPEITTNDHNGDTPNSSEFDNIREEMWSENSNILVTTEDLGNLESMASTFKAHGSQTLLWLSLISITSINASLKSVHIIDLVWGCGGGKAPGPDGFTFEFIKRYWDIIVISWEKKKKEKLFIMKVDFEKAFDSLDWKFLDHIMEQMGFTNKWRRWIHGCLDSTFGSVFVNGSPTKEFKIQKGLRQGDPLSPWSLENVKNLCRILRCFHLASGLKVNFFKSKFFGVGVTNNDTHTFASILNLQPSSFPCTYLGLPIGANMCKSRHWKPIIDKFHKRLSSWKDKNLSYGGRLTLLKSVLGALGIYFFSLFNAPVSIINYLEKLRRIFFWGGSLDQSTMSWIAWKKVCSNSRCGGLGIGSLLATNFAMLSKWWWRFHTDTNSLWRSIIISIHGDHGGFDYNDNSFIRQPPSPWKTILGINKPLLTVNVDLNSISPRELVMVHQPDSGMMCGLEPRI